MSMSNTGINNNHVAGSGTSTALADSMLVLLTLYIFSFFPLSAI